MIGFVVVFLFFCFFSFLTCSLPPGYFSCIVLSLYVLSSYAQSLVTLTSATTTTFTTPSNSTAAEVLVPGCGQLSFFVRGANGGPGGSIEQYAGGTGAEVAGVFNIGGPATMFVLLQRSMGSLSLAQVLVADHLLSRALFLWASTLSFRTSLLEERAGLLF